jgi:GcrA cell cycle regulator
MSESLHSENPCERRRWGQNWSPSHDQQLRQLVEKGLTATKIGDALGISKNAVIGRCRCVGLVLAASLGPRPVKSLPEPRIKFPAGDCCRWPHGHVGEPHFHFCGEPVTRGRPFCADHAARAYLRKPEPEANPSMPALTGEEAAA